MSPSFYLYNVSLSLNNHMDFQSFSHGQMHSKIWLCELIESYLMPNHNILVLGCWHNVMGMIMMIRNPHRNLKIMGIDIDSEAIEVADKLTEAWRFEEYNPFKNEIADANRYSYDKYDIIINCSVEHMDSTEWFDNIPKGKLVCLQSMSLNIVNDPIYKIKSPNTTLEAFSNKFKLETILFLGQKEFDYEINPYSRYCVIGYK